MVKRCGPIGEAWAGRLRVFTQGGKALETLLFALVLILCMGTVIRSDYNSYKKNQFFAENRKVGQELLMEVAKRQEDHFKEHQTYTTDLTALGYKGVEDLSLSSPGGVYKVVVTSADAFSFALAAEPQEDQLGDSKCGALTYDKKGTAKSARGSDGTACW